MPLNTLKLPSHRSTHNVPRDMDAAALPLAIGQVETSRQRFFASVAAAVLVAGFLFMGMAYWTPGTDGGDRNGYLLGGRLFAGGHVSITAPDPFVAVGSHWIETSPAVFHLKYAPGLPLIYGAIYALAGAHAPLLCNLVSPVCAALALYACFLILRGVMPSFYAMLGMIALACSPVTLIFAITPSSHACCFCAVAWGMYFLLQAWRNGGRCNEILAGLLLGIAATVRYTEATLVIPMIIAIVFPLRRRDRTSAVLLLISWLMPVAAVAVFNRITLGQFSGYGATHESTAFSAKLFCRNLPVMLAQLNGIALPIVFPLALLGLTMMFRWNWRIALLICAWIVPTLLVYTAYYWTPQGYTLAYLRFVLPAFGGLVLPAAWLLARQFGRVHHGHWLAGLIIAVGVIPAFQSALVFAEDFHRHNAACVFAGEQVKRRIPEHSLIFSEQRLLPHFQTIGDYQPYVFCVLTRRYLSALAVADSESPQALQPARARELAILTDNHSDAQLARMQLDLLDNAFKHGQKIFLVLSESDVDFFRHQFLNTGAWRLRVIDAWEEDASLLTDAKNPIMASTADGSLQQPMNYRAMEIVEVAHE